MKNKLSDLNNHLFEELERLNDEDLTGDALMEEIKRSEAITDIAGKIIENGSLVLKDSYNAAVSLVDKYDWTEIKCVDNNRLKTIDEIHEEIWEQIKK